MSLCSIASIRRQIREGVSSNVAIPYVVCFNPKDFNKKNRNTNQLRFKSCDRVELLRAVTPFRIDHGPDKILASISLMRKQLDPRIPILISNNVKKNYRSFIVLVGDKGRDQVRFLPETGLNIVSI